MKLIFKNLFCRHGSLPLLCNPRLKKAADGFSRVNGTIQCCGKIVA